ncbi:FimV/HubP family polar landmark protein [Pseudomonas sp. 3A(2025)]
MVQVRKLVVAIAAASALSSGMAHALGLGELSVKSTLNQPLLAEIELTDARGINASQLVPSLGTTADFAQAGVTRQAFLSDLTFTPVINPGGKSVLRITSSKPVRDPYVKFLVQVLWPNGRAQREYSLLLDPPKFAENAAPAPTPAPAPVAAPAQLPAVTPAVTAPAPAAPATAKPVDAPLPAPAADKSAQYVTSNNDTLWEIAAKVRNGGTIQQTMLAIQALNPDAFIDGNINRLKKGQVLRLPTAQQTTSLSQSQAVAEVAQQYRAWREGRRTPAGTRQVDATRRASAGAAPAQVEARDNLSLVAASAASAQKGAAADGDLANKLAVTQEALDTTRRDNAELQSRMSDLQSQLDKLQRLMTLKNDQLAKMQAGTAEPAPASPALPATAVDAAGTPIKPAGEIAPEDALAAAQVATPPADQPLAVEPVTAEEPASDPLKAVLDNPVMLGLIGGAALLILALLLLFLARRRNAKAEEEKHKRMARVLAEDSQFAADMDLNAPADGFDGLEVSPSYKMAPAAVAAAAANASRERPTDPLVQAEIHIAYGRMNQAVELLEESVKEEPQRDDLRLKLMEIYAEQGNHKAFAAHERKLVAAGKLQAEAGPAPVIAPVIVPPAPEPKAADTAAPVAAVAAAAAVAATTAALSTELDAKYLEELLADDEPEQAPAVEPEPEVDSLDNDFDLSLDALEAAPADEVVTVDDLDGLLLDDSLSSVDEPVIAEPLSATSPEPDDLSDFDLDLADEDPVLSTEDDFLVGLGEDPLDLGESEPEKASVDLELPEDFDLSLADEIETEHASEAFASEIDDVNAELDRLSQSLESPPLEEQAFTSNDMSAFDDEPEFDFLSGTDEAATKLDLARAYIDMGDAEGARDILGEVVDEGDEGQKSEARELLASIA